MYALSGVFDRWDYDMKKLNYLLAILAVSLLWGCSDDDSTALSISTETLTFPYKGGSLTLSINSDGQWGISQLPEWLSISVAGGTGNSEVTLTAAPNSDYEDREECIVIYTTDTGYEKILTIRQIGSHASEIQVSNLQERVLGGRITTTYTPFALETIEDYIDVSCDTQWEIEVPSWVTVAFSGKTIDAEDKTIYAGSGKIYLMANETYTGDDARDGSIILRTLSRESQVVVPIRQLGKDELYGYKRLVANSGYICNYKVGSNVEYIVELIVFGIEQLESLAYANLNHGLVISACKEGTYDPTFLTDFTVQPDADYTVFAIGRDSNYKYAPLSKVVRYQFHSLTDKELSPRAEIKDVTLNDGKLQWTVSPNDYTAFYMTTVLDMSSVNGLSYNFLSLFYTWSYQYVGGFAYKGADVEKTFSLNLDTNENCVIVTLPFGFTNKPSLVEFYVTDFF